MKITLLQCTNLYMAAHMAAICYDSEAGVSNERDMRRIRNCIKNGHYSVMEHVIYSFDIRDISRACSHQLVRHRIASYSQQSQRYTRIDTNEQWFRLPPNAPGHMEQSLESIGMIYRELLDCMRPEDARMVLPNATLTRIGMTINWRSLLNFFQLRLPSDAQWEIRELAQKIMQALPVAHRELFDYALEEACEPQPSSSSCGCSCKGAATPT